MDQLNNALRVLVIDDDPDDRLIIAKQFERIEHSSYVIEMANDYVTGLKMIDAHNHDVYLIDYQLGEHNGIELLANSNLHDRIEPFIMLTGARDVHIEREAMRQGAADYLVKGVFDPELLDRVIRYSVQRKQAEQERIEELKAINAAKDEFISLASHQLRTPATIVKQYIGMLLDNYMGELTSSQRAMLETAYDGNERQIQIVNDLLRVAQVDAGQITLHKTRINITRLVRQIVIEQQGKFNGREQMLLMNGRQKAPLMIEADELHLRMALENIIDNASKYSDEHTTTTVSLEKQDKLVHISIADQGVGINQLKLDKLFQKFSRIDNPLSTKVGGTGLGLYLTRTIIQLHGGDITVSSTENVGTTFNITLPC